MSTPFNFLVNDYPNKTINLIIEYAIDQQIELYFFNQLTSIPQLLTIVQLAGIKKFGGINILLETGQTYQIGLIIEELQKGTYQEVRLDDLIVDNKTLNKIRNKFG